MGLVRVCTLFTGLDADVSVSIQMTTFTASSYLAGILPQD